jgi:hypothetical protein
MRAQRLTNIATVTVAALCLWLLLSGCSPAQTQADQPGGPPSTAGSMPPISDLIAPAFRSNRDAIAVANFCAGHTYQRFNLVAANAFVFAQQRQRLNQQYPSAIADQRYQEAMASAETAFVAGTGPFLVSGSGGSLQLYLPSTARFQVIDVKSVSNIMSGSYVNVFVQVEYPDSRTAPSETYFVSVGNGFDPSGRILKRTLLVIPTRGHLVVDDIGGGLPVDVFGGSAASVRRIRDLDLFW